MSDVIEDLKLGKLCLYKHLENVETESDKINQVDMSDDKDSAKRNEISTNNEETMTGAYEESDKIDQIE